MMQLHCKDVVADYEDEVMHYIDVVVQSEDMVLITRLEKYCILKTSHATVPSRSMTPCSPCTFLSAHPPPLGGGEGISPEAEFLGGQNYEEFSQSSLLMDFTFPSP
jgi:hypothetical protein